MQAGLSEKTEQHNLYLVGFMGAGKSTVGAALAALLQRRHLDTDRLIEKQVGRRIADIFATDGENFFRELESRVLADICRHGNLVVSLGGGSVASPGNWDLIRQSGKSIYLAWPAAVLANRILTDPARPLVAMSAESSRTEELSKLLATRRPLYERCDLTIHCKAGLAPAEVAAEIVNRIREKA